MSSAEEFPEHNRTASARAWGLARTGNYDRARQLLSDAQATTQIEIKLSSLAEAATSPVSADQELARLTDALLLDPQLIPLDHLVNITRATSALSDGTAAEKLYMVLLSVIEDQSDLIEEAVEFLRKRGRLQPIQMIAMRGRSLSGVAHASPVKRYLVRVLSVFSRQMSHHVLELRRFLHETQCATALQETLQEQLCIASRAMFENGEPACVDFLPAPGARTALRGRQELSLYYLSKNPSWLSKAKSSLTEAACGDECVPRTLYWLAQAILFAFEHDSSTTLAQAQGILQVIVDSNVQGQLLAESLVELWAVERRLGNAARAKELQHRYSTLIRNGNGQQLQIEPHPLLQESEVLQLIQQGLDHKALLRSERADAEQAPTELVATEEWGAKFELLARLSTAALSISTTPHETTALQTLRLPLTDETVLSVEYIQSPPSALRVSEYGSVYVATELRARDIALPTSLIVASFELVQTELLTILEMALGDVACVALVGERAEDALLYPKHWVDCRGNAEAERAFLAAGKICITDSLWIAAAAKNTGISCLLLNALPPYDCVGLCSLMLPALLWSRSEYRCLSYAESLELKLAARDRAALVQALDQRQLSPVWNSPRDIVDALAELQSLPLQRGASTPRWSSKFLQRHRQFKPATLEPF